MTSTKRAKQLWLLAGGNGAGKSTFYRCVLQPRGLVLVNADNIARNIDPDNAELASYAAAQLAEHLRYDLLNKGVSFCFETVFSHPSKIDFMAHAKALGYEVILVFIHLDNSELNSARVAQRVSEGGHSVPEEKIVSRIPRTLTHIKAALPLADQVYLLDNTSNDQPLRCIASLNHGVLDCGLPNNQVTPLPLWASELLSDYH
jgi:predicted ABC-type ATPase